MRIAILSDGIPPESSGGAETIAWSLACRLSQTGHEVHVITTTRGQPFEESREGIATYHLHSAYPVQLWPYFSVFNPQTIGPLRALLRRIGPDIVNGHTIHNNLSFFSLTTARQLGIAAVWNAHDVSSISSVRLSHFIDPTARELPPPAAYRLPPFHDLRQLRFRWNPLRIRLTRAILRSDARLRVSVSRALADALEANGAAPLRVVRNGIDTTRFEHTRPEAVRALRDRLGLGKRRVILFAGRLRPDKGSHQLIAAMDRVIRRVGDAALLVLADRGYKPQGRMEQRFPEVFGKHVVESGWLAGDDLVAAYHLADVVTVPSVCLDSFPTVNLEAMAAGKPVVATCFGGSPEAILDGETGYIVNPFDTERFAGRLKALLTDDDLRRSMGQAGARRAKEDFNLERYTNDMLEVYRDATGG